MTVPVVEVFRSIQGEGLLAGVVSVFVRLAGCDLACPWCDTNYARDRRAAQRLSVAALAQQVAACDCPHVVVTGGEPLLTPELPDLLAALRESGRHVTLETAATRYRRLACDLISISPKLANSTPPPGTVSPDRRRRHERRRLDVPALRRYLDEMPYQLKFVVARRADLAEIDNLLNQLGNVDPDRVLLMPQAATAAEHRRRDKIVVPLCLERGYRYCPRLQVLLWGARRGV